MSVSEMVTVNLEKHVHGAGYAVAVATLANKVSKLIENISYL